MVLSASPRPPTLSQAQPIRILVVDDDPLFRNGLVSLFAGTGDFHVVGQAASGGEAIVQAQCSRPDVILMDLSMPGIDGLEATRHIKRTAPEVRIDEAIILTVEEDSDRLFDAIRAGANGYLLKTIVPRALLSALRKINRGEACLSRAMVTRLMAEFVRHAHRAPAIAAPAANLSPREREVLESVALGKANREIASALAVSESTVKHDVRSILDKLHLANRVQAATFALRAGFVEPPRPKSP